MSSEEKFKFDKGEAVLKQLRDRLKISQQELAHKLGTGIATISRWETGASSAPKLTIPQFKKLVAVLAEAGLTLDDLPDRLGPSEPPTV